LAIVLVIIVLAACSCSLSQFSYWGERGSTVSLIEEQADQRSLQEFAELEGERRRAEVAEERAKAGLLREVKCPRCHRAVPLPAEARKGDQLRCGTCGKTFAFDPNPRSEAGGN
jgi:ribosomal protein S27AE